MKRLFLPLFAFTSIAFGVVSCVPSDSCKNCEAVTYESGTSNVVERQDAVEYCGDDLFAKENSQPVVVGSDSTVWECK